MADEKEIQYAIMRGINFSGSGRKKKDDDEHVKTKARKKGYHTGGHGSASAKHKEEIRQRVKKRASQRRK